MHNSGPRFRVTRFASIQLAIVGFMTLSMPTAPASGVSYSDYRARIRDYQTCANSLLAAGIVEADAAEACAAALAPRDISTCVTRIDEDTLIAATDALTGCRGVRRPVELAVCVVDINENTQNAVPLDVLNYCRRSLLPVRFSSCVVGLSRETALAPGVAMDTCIAAGDRPRNVLPSFVPRSEGIPTTPGTEIVPDADATTQPLRLTPLVPRQ